LVIAHASGDWFGPANSIEMLKGAVAAGADMVDVDIRVTADGVLVGSHDDRIGTTSISTSTYDQLQRLDLRDSWRNPNRRTVRTPVRVPTVEQVLTVFPQHRVSLEFKTTGGEQALCDLLRRTDRTEDVHVGSAGDAAVDRFSTVCPEVTTTVTDALVPVMQAARASGTDWCSPVPIGQPPLRVGGNGSEAFRLTSEGVDWDHDHGLAVFTWTADTEDALEHVATLGVDAVYTARPDLATRILNRDR
jgi:glycerophosphoryl diester phosphodiesterase